MTRKLLALALAVALATAGCIGSNDEEALGTDSEDSGEEPEDATEGAEGAPSGTGEGATSADAGPPPINRTHEDAAEAGIVLIDPGQSLGAKTQFAKTSYDNGLNGTWVLGYEVQPEPGHTGLAVETTADFADPLEETPEYDLFVYGPGGDVVAMSYESGSEEQVSVDDLEDGTYLALLYYQQGAQDPITTHIEVT